MITKIEMINGTPPKNHSRPNRMQDANQKIEKPKKTYLKTSKNLASLKPKQATGDQNTKIKPNQKHQPKNIRTLIHPWT